MSKNLWQKERSAIFRSLVKQYMEEGYSNREANKLAKEDVEDIMSDKESFVNDMWNQVFEDE